MTEDRSDWRRTRSKGMRGIERLLMGREERARMAEGTFPALRARRGFHLQHWSATSELRACLSRIGHANPATVLRGCNLITRSSENGRSRGRKQNYERSQFSFQKEITVYFVCSVCCWSKIFLQTFAETE